MANIQLNGSEELDDNERSLNLKEPLTTTQTVKEEAIDSFKRFHLKDISRMQHLF
jgi:hypothetical protein